MWSILSRIPYGSGHGRIIFTFFVHGSGLIHIVCSSSYHCASTMVKKSTPSYLHNAKHKPRLQFELPPELMIDPCEPDWDYDMPNVEQGVNTNTSIRRRNRLEPGDQMRSCARNGQQSHEGAALSCFSNTVSGAEKRMIFLSDENSLLVKSGRGLRHRRLPCKSANSRSCETEVGMGQEPSDSRPTPTAVAEHVDLRRRHKKSNSKKPFRVIMPVMEESTEIAPIEASCKDLNPLYPLMQGIPNYPGQFYTPFSFQCEEGSSENPQRKPSRRHTDDYEDNSRTLVKFGCTSLSCVSSKSKHEHGAALFDSKQSFTSPTSVVHTSSCLSVQTSETEWSDLQHEVSVLNRLSSIKTHDEKPRQIVRFAHPLVTAVKQRPRTLPEDVPALFFDPNELVILEEDRLARLYEEQVECVAFGGDNEFQISVCFPVTRTRDKMSCSFDDDNSCVCPAFEIEVLPKTSDDDDSHVCPGVEVEAMPKTSREI